MGTRGKFFNSQLHQGFITLRRFTQTPFSVLVSTNPKFSKLTHGSMCYWFATAYLHRNMTLGTPFLF